MSGSDGCGQVPKLARSASAAWLRWPARRDWRSARCGRVATKAVTARKPTMSSRFVGARGSDRSRPCIPRCGQRSRSSSIRLRAAIPNRRCAGRARARTCSPPSCSRSTASGSATRPSPSCSASTATACKRRTRPSRATSIPIATRSSSTSTQDAERCLQRGVPVISVDTKKKELVGNFKNGGREWQPEGRAGACRRPRLPQRRARQGDPVRRLRRRRQRRLRERRHRPRHAGVRGHVDRGVVEASRARSGTRTRARSSSPPTRAAATAIGARVWKHELQRLADKLDIAIHVSHFPPGTSKWNKVEHRLFSFISINWRGRPLRTYETVVNLIGEHDQPRWPRRSRSPRSSALSDRQEGLRERVQDDSTSSPTTSTATGTTSSSRARSLDRSTSAFAGPNRRRWLLVVGAVFVR